ncbi:oxidoreductase, aldo/keto reductase family protein [Trichomonas vaginalis G3]|uniref:Oxidoreductase, aldo/keto reductase family protein n=1 Tax=Trichomonas vaginalis (strain ATCC PRA-98 / G3) TaxID=412133 RepID=A2EYY6_TRIV3|nr:oxidoreductase protein [Trichomonas vaginalis G3]EAY02148.1 oxidoreductase, aldo/keto reductase family protein [Trichomonas vaginalis G3]KAI5513756.1 oxidoreductase protein [Trichomonas vaginalis G3]|eukprot:XP_001330856.1 oxidoreductase, aldo/keto reductase family protein [Trichomonas vaginalis G3]
MNRIPTIGLGTWKSPRSEDLVNAITYAIKEAGYVHIDCALCYENEDIVGQALQQCWDSGIKRENIWITSKLWNTHHRLEIVEEACRKTLKDLRLDYLDLYLMHYPFAFQNTGIGGSLNPLDEKGNTIFDDGVSLIDTWKAMEKLVEKGLVKRIGVSNWTINQLERLKYSDAKTTPYTNQVEFNLYMQQGPLREYMHKEGIIVTGYSTLGTPDWAKPDEPVVLKDEELNKIAAETGKSVGEVELKFLLTIEPGASLLAKSVTPERIYKNNHLDFELTKDQIQRLRNRERFYRYVDPRKTWKRDGNGDGW